MDTDILQPVVKTQRQLGDKKMDRKKAEELGWVITGKDDNVKGEKGIMIFLGRLNLVLKMIEKVTKPA